MRDSTGMKFAGTEPDVVPERMGAASAVAARLEIIA